jgi:hypothetical protein
VVQVFTELFEYLDCGSDLRCRGSVHDQM